jgi:hypothetical protein
MRCGRRRHLPISGSLLYGLVGIPAFIELTKSYGSAIFTILFAGQCDFTDVCCIVHGKQRQNSGPPAVFFVGPASQKLRISAAKATPLAVNSQQKQRKQREIAKMGLRHTASTLFPIDRRASKNRLGVAPSGG